jgi:hypothetical protein
LPITVPDWLVAGSGEKKSVKKNQTFQQQKIKHFNKHFNKKSNISTKKNLESAPLNRQQFVGTTSE